MHPLPLLLLPLPPPRQQFLLIRHKNTWTLWEKKKKKRKSQIYECTQTVLGSRCLVSLWDLNTRAAGRATLAHRSEFCSVSAQHLLTRYCAARTLKVGHGCHERRSALRSEVNLQARMTCCHKSSGELFFLRRSIIGQ